MWLEREAVAACSGCELILQTPAKDIKDALRGQGINAGSNRPNLTSAHSCNAAKSLERAAVAAVQRVRERNRQRLI
jgi:hypothetical protein